MGIGPRIREMRENRGMTQKELAFSIGVTPSAVTNYEAGVSHPKEPVLHALFRALQVDANYLFQDDLPQEVRQRALGGLPAWSIPLVEAYEAAPVILQESVCKVLDIDPIAVPGQDVPIKKAPAPSEQRPFVLRAARETPGADIDAEAQQALVAQRTAEALQKHRAKKP